jgi:hypothetical protein
MQAWHSKPDKVEILDKTRYPPKLTVNLKELVLSIVLVEEKEKANTGDSCTDYPE